MKYLPALRPGACWAALRAAVSMPRAGAYFFLAVVHKGSAAADNMKCVSSVCSKWSVFVKCCLFDVVLPSPSLSALPIFFNLVNSNHQCNLSSAVCSCIVNIKNVLTVWLRNQIMHINMLA